MNGAMWRSVAVAGLMAGAGLYAAPASAQALMSRTWVAANGFDTNACTTSSPCQTFAGALAKTAAGGEINCLNAGGFGPVTITKSVSIVCNNVEAGVIATTGTNPTSAVVIDGAGIVVTLSGLDLDGFGSGVNGVLVNNAAAVVLDNIKARNFTGYGVRFEPTSNATLTVTRSLLSGNGNTSAPSGGLYGHPAASAAVKITVSDSELVNNVVDGARFESTGAAFNATVVNSVASGNGSAGLRYRGVGSNVASTVNGVTLTNNTAYGLVGSGSGVLVNVGDSTISSNGTGVTAAAGAVITTFGDNRVVGNTNPGGFSGSQVKQ